MMLAWEKNYAKIHKKNHTESKLNAISWTNFSLLENVNDRSAKKNDFSSEKKNIYT